MIRSVTPPTPPLKVLIVGAGFAGLAAARTLGGKPGIQVTLLDRRNHHLFQPLLYQVATAALSPAEIAAPIRSIVSRFDNIRVLMGEAQAVHLAQKTVTADFGTLTYDRLILACGVKQSYFGHPAWEQWATGIKSLDQATEIRRRMLTAFELAERESDPKRVRALLTIVVVGGGPTGVEVAGALGELTRYTLAKDFRSIDPKLTRIVLVEAGSRLLGAFSPKLSARAARDLEALGVQVWTQTRVTEVSAEGVRLDHEFLNAGTVIWAAGVESHSMNTQLGVPLSSSGHILVESDLSLPGHPEVFVCGDQAHFVHQTGQPLPGLAPIALQQGRYAAQMIVRDVRGLKRGAFHYRDKGQMATIGRSRAVAEMGSLRFTGLLAWVLWMCVHIYYLIGFKNRLMVLIQWAWAYVTFRRGARLIIKKM